MYILPRGHLFVDCRSDFICCVLALSFKYVFISGGLFLLKSVPSGEIFISGCFVVYTLPRGHLFVGFRSNFLCVLELSFRYVFFNSRCDVLRRVSGVPGQRAVVSGQRAAQLRDVA